jgi:predicted nuclease with TOPRIM domain
MGHSVSTLLEIDQRLRRGLVPSIDGKLINATNINAALLNLEILRWHDAESVVLEMDAIRTENNRKLQAQREEIASLKKNVNELENKIKTLNEDHVDLSNECSAMNTAFEQIDQLLNNKRRKTVPPVIESGAFVDPSRSQGRQTTLVYEQDGGDDIDNASVGSFTVSSLEGAGHGLGKHDLKEIFSKEAEEAVESKAEGAVLE